MCFEDNEIDLEPFSYEVTINGISTYCTKFYLNHEFVSMACIVDIDCNFDIGAEVSFSYRRGFYSGNGIVEDTEYNIKTGKYDIYIELLDYNESQQAN